MTSPLDDAFFARPVVTVAQALVGCALLVDGIGGVIAETEAYHPEEPASHSYRGPTPRNAVMFGPVGRLYVYRSYGIHFCANIVAGEAPGSAVLLRALIPTAGLDRMRARRGPVPDGLLCNGPGRLTQALGLDLSHNGLSVSGRPFAFTERDQEVALVSGPRIGISKAVDLPWRFGLAGSRGVSRPFPRLSAAVARSADRA